MDSDEILDKIHDIHETLEALDLLDGPKTLKAVTKFENGNPKDGVRFIRTLPYKKPLRVRLKLS